MIRISELYVPLAYDDGLLKKLAAAELGASADEIHTLRLVRRAVDARHKYDVHFICTVDVGVTGSESAMLARRNSRRAERIDTEAQAARAAIAMTGAAVRMEHRNAADRVGARPGRG